MEEPFLGAEFQSRGPSCSEGVSWLGAAAGLLHPVIMPGCSDPAAASVQLHAAEHEGTRSRRMQFQARDGVLGRGMIPASDPDCPPWRGGAGSHGLGC